MVNYVRTVLATDEAIRTVTIVVLPQVPGHYDTRYTCHPTSSLGLADLDSSQIEWFVPSVPFIALLVAYSGWLIHPLSGNEKFSFHGGPGCVAVSMIHSWAGVLFGCCFSCCLLTFITRSRKASYCIASRQRSNEGPHAYDFLAVSNQKDSLHVPQYHT